MMFNELSVLTWWQLIILGIFLIGSILFILMAFSSVFFPPQGINRIVYDGKPDPNCDDCHGLGVLNIGHEHFECDCPCKMRFY